MSVVAYGPPGSDTGIFGDDVQFVETRRNHTAVGLPDALIGAALDAGWSVEVGGTRLKLRISEHVQNHHKNTPAFGLDWLNWKPFFTSKPCFVASVDPVGRVSERLWYFEAQGSYVGDVFEPSPGQGAFAVDTISYEDALLEYPRETRVDILATTGAVLTSRTIRTRSA